MEERRSYLNLAINLLEQHLEQLRDSQTSNSQNSYVTKNLETYQAKKAEYNFFKEYLDIQYELMINL